jgi:hypothetical protein
VITKADTPGTDTREAIENPGGSMIPVLGLTGVKNAIKAKGLAGTLEANETQVKDTVKRTGGMQLIRTIVVSHMAGGKPQGTIYVFVMTKPPRANGVDTHFGLRDATIEDIASDGGKGDDFGKTP